MGVKLEGINLLGFYFANKQAKVPLFEWFTTLPQDLLESPTLMIGDMNTGKHFIDEPGKTFVGSDYIDQLEELGWVDIWRHFHGDAREFTWFSQTGNGFRLDQAFVSPSAVSRVEFCAYAHEPRKSRTSDHSMMTLNLLS